MEDQGRQCALSRPPYDDRRRRPSASERTFAGHLKPFLWYLSLQHTAYEATSNENQLPRKLIAIMYADVAGYSRLTGEDEEGTHRRASKYLDTFTTEIQNQRGKVVHFAGDAILSEFPTISNALTCTVSVLSNIANRNLGLANINRPGYSGIPLAEPATEPTDRRASYPISPKNQGSGDASSFFMT